AKTVLLGFADLKRVVRSVDDWSFWASGAHVDRANVLCHAVNESASAEFVRWIEDDKPGQSAHECVVFHGLLAWAVFADRDAAVRADKLRIHARISDTHAQLVITFVAKKNREGRRERQLAGKREAAGDRNHVGLCNADGKKALRKLFLEFG